MRLSAFETLLRRLIFLHEVEVPNAASAFTCFFLILFSYFLLVPLRDDAGVLLGTRQLPMLFAGSLVLIATVVPVAAGYVASASDRRSALRFTYRMMAAILCGFLLLSWHGEAGQRHAAAALRPVGNDSEGEAQAAAPMELAAVRSSHGEKGVAENVKRRSSSSSGRELQGPEGGRQAAGAAGRPGGVPDAVRDGDSGLSRWQRLVGASFYLWMGVQNLLGISLLWARCADVFPPESASRLFGALGAGATLGQLCGSMAASLLCKTTGCHSSGNLLLAILALLLASQVVYELDPLPLRSGIKASLRQSPTAADASAAAELLGDTRLRPRAAGAFPDDHRPVSPARAPECRGASLAPRTLLLAMRRSTTALADGLQLIASSGYLLHICCHLLLNYTVSSLFYFERSLVMASSVSDARARREWFASINSCSAAVIVTLQLFATGRILKSAGISFSLAAIPLTALAALACLAARPLPTTVALAEVARKIVTYAVGRPAREVLFTVVSSEEKYKAKVVIDTVIQRLGDTLGAAVFRVIDGTFRLGPAAVAVGGLPVSGLWVVVALALGRRHIMLARSAAPSSPPPAL